MSRRLPVIVIIVGIIVAGLVIDRTRDDTPVATEEASVDDVVFPIAAGPGALSSTWFCAGGTGDEERFADHTVEIANRSEQAVTVALTVFGGSVAPPLTTVEPEDLDEEAGDEEASDEDGSGEESGGEEETTDTTTESGSSDDGERPASTDPEPEEQRIEIPARSQQTVRLGDVIEAPIVSALVEAPSGGIVVEHRVTSVHGFDVKPCATAGATTWHFPYGDTTVDARELLVLFNPFPDDAIVDGRFSTEDGVREPERFDGLVVPGRGSIAVDLGDDVTRREEVAGTSTARAGRIVVDRIVRIDRDTDRGLTVQSGVPVPQGTWVFPDGRLSDTLREEYVVYNPGEELAEVAIEFVLDEPETNGIPEPIDLSLPPGAHQVIDVNADGRVPANVSHSAVVRSENGVPVVAERLIFAAGESSGARKGISVSTGSPVESEEWAFAAGAVNDTSDEWIVILNLDPQILAEVDVTAVTGGQLVPVSGLQGLEIGPGQRLAIRVGEHIGNREPLPLLVTSSEPVVVERGMYRVGRDQRGMSNAVGVPSELGIRLPIDPLEAPVTDDLGEEPTEPTDGDEGVPEAPDDVELPDPDQTIVIDDPDAEADAPARSSSTSSTTAAEEPDD